MAQDVALWGVAYTDVPEVRVPKQGGGMAAFHDVSDTTASAADVAQGKLFHAADGTLTEGTASGGGGVSADPDKPVKFIDYDGVLLYSYTPEEFAELEAMPADPTHDGLVAQGWNWTLADAQEYVAEYGILIVGQSYTTDDGKTRIYIRLSEERRKPYLGVSPNGTVTIDWGDGSAQSTLTGTSDSTVKTTYHQYAAAGDYVITLEATSGKFTILNTKYSSGYCTDLLRDTAATGRTSTSTSRVYAHSIRKVELGDNAYIGAGAFQYCLGMEAISIPTGNTMHITDYSFYYCSSLSAVVIPQGVNINGRAFQYCSGLKYLSAPSNVKSVPQYCFASCSSIKALTFTEQMTPQTYSFSSMTSLETLIGNVSPSDSVCVGCASLSAVTIKNSATTIWESAFARCYSLTSVTIPESVTAIRSYAFRDCYGMAEYHLKPTTPPTLSASNAFNNMPSDCIIYVPYSEDHSILESYKTASNWSSYASRMQEEPA